MEEFFQQAAIQSKRNERREQTITDQFIEHICIGFEAKVNAAARDGLKYVILYEYDDKAQFLGRNISNIVLVQLPESEPAYAKLKLKFKPAQVNLTRSDDVKNLIILDWSNIKV